RVGCAAHVALDIHAHDFVDLHADLTRLELLEAGGLGGDIVDSDGNVANPVDAHFIRVRGEGGGRPGVAGSDGGVRRDRPGGIGYDSGEGPVRVLAEGRIGQQQRR